MLGNPILTDTYLGQPKRMSRYFMTLVSLARSPGSYNFENVLSELYLLGQLPDFNQTGTSLQGL